MNDIVPVWGGAVRSAEMVQALEAARWAAVHQLQRRACSRDPSSFGSSVADHAVGLALNPHRCADSYLAYNAWRDARKVITARLRSSRARHVDLTEVDRAMSRNFPHETTSIYIGAIPRSESTILWKNAFDQLRIVASDRNWRAAACLDHWRDGDEDQETAASLGISVSYVKKLKRLIREIACDLFPDEVRA